jgi:hypothetical protein
MSDLGDTEKRISELLEELKLLLGDNGRWEVRTSRPLVDLPQMPGDTCTQSTPGTTVIWTLTCSREVGTIPQNAPKPRGAIRGYNGT